MLTMTFDCDKKRDRSLECIYVQYFGKGKVSRDREIKCSNNKHFWPAQDIRLYD